MRNFAAGYESTIFQIPVICGQSRHMAKIMQLSVDRFFLIIIFIKCNMSIYKKNWVNSIIDMNQKSKEKRRIKYLSLKSPF